MDVTVLKDVATIIGALATPLVAATAAFFGIRTYAENSHLERARWLASLYEKFYEKDHLKRVREVLDSKAVALQEIKQKISDAELSDYLNFFEFVAVLKKSGQLKQQEIEDLFGYYLGRLSNRPEMREYIVRNGYELLDELLRDRAKVK